MIRAIHSRFGAIAGAGVGLVLNLASSQACCGNPTLTLAGQILSGLLVAAVAMTLAVAFASLVSPRPTWAFALVGLIVAVIVGGLLGPVAYVLPHPMIAMIVCAILGALLALLIARLWCPRCTPTLTGGLRS